MSSFGRSFRISLYKYINTFPKLNDPVQLSSYKITANSLREKAAANKSV